jgi:hypothetical protein
MLIDALHKLSLAGFQISDYQYTGFGSIYFVDFILFHKLLGIHRMLSVEYSTSIKKRIHFNRPYKCVDIAIKPIADVIPTLSPDLKHILWLDYDSLLWRGHLEDIRLATTYLSSGSILLVTVDVQPPEGDGPSAWRDYFVAEAGHYVGPRTEIADYARSELVKVNVEILTRAIRSGLAGRDDLDYHPLFSFLYADGHQMLTLGGMLGSAGDLRQIDLSQLAEQKYVKRKPDDKPFEINVPRVTRKERLHLDFEMPCDDAWKPREFEMSPEAITAYREIYRFFPAYAELLL